MPITTKGPWKGQKRTVHTDSQPTILLSQQRYPASLRTLNITAHYANREDYLLFPLSLSPTRCHPASLCVYLPSSLSHLAERPRGRVDRSWTASYAGSVSRFFPWETILFLIHASGRSCFAGSCYSNPTCEYWVLTCERMFLSLEDFMDGW